MENGFSGKYLANQVSVRRLTAQPHKKFQHSWREHRLCKKAGRDTQFLPTPDSCTAAKISHCFTPFKNVRSVMRIPDVILQGFIKGVV